MANRSERLLGLMQALRRRRTPVAGAVLAEELGISLRSLYRDIGTLSAMGVPVDGEAGIGYQLRGDVFLPPMMFSIEETEALVLGLRTLIHGPDAELGRMAHEALVKVKAVLPAERRSTFDAIGLFALPRTRNSDAGDLLPTLRRALREEMQLRIAYADRKGAATSRTIYPLALGYFEDRQVLVSWCTLRQDWRRFRIDAISACEVTGQRLPEPRRSLFHRWRIALGLPDLA